MEQVPNDIGADRADSSQHTVSADHSMRLADWVLAQGTRDTYRWAVNRFERWLGNRRSDDAALSDYLNELFERGLSPATASVVVAALVDRARWGGTSSPYGKRTALTLTGFRRSGKRGRGQVVGIKLAGGGTYLKPSRTERQGVWTAGCPIDQDRIRLSAAHVRGVGAGFIRHLLHR